MKFDVIRQHLGDRLYWAGEEREAEEHDVRHLVESGVLVAKSGEKTKAKNEEKNNEEQPEEPKAKN